MTNSVNNKDNILTGSTRFTPDPNIRNILVTGGAGFIGSWVLRHLVVVYPEYNVICLDKLTYASSIKNIDLLRDRPNFTFVKGDVTKKHQVFQIFDDYKVDTVIHLAAESDVEHSFCNPYVSSHTNIYGTQVILEACKNFKVYRVIHMSTDEVYGEVKLNEPDLTEAAILQPTNPYSASKASGDMLVSAYIKSYHIPCIIIRCSNMYGPHQFPEKIVPKFISLLMRGEKCTLHGDGQNMRRYLHASDGIDAIDTILHKGEIGSIYNAGSETELSNLDLYKNILEAFGYDSADTKELESHVEYTRDRLYNDLRYAIDSQKMYNLGWSPRVGFVEGLKSTKTWYVDYGFNWWDTVDRFLVPFPEIEHDSDSIE